MSIKAGNTAIEQLELFRPPPRRPMWSELPEHVKGEVRELVGQMLPAHTEVSHTDGAEGEENDD